MKLSAYRRFFRPRSFLTALGKLARTLGTKTVYSAPTPLLCLRTGRHPELGET